jgi:hypothetical protein
VCRTDSYRIDAAILFFFKTQIAANSLRLLAKFVTQKKGKRACQNVQVIFSQSLSIENLHFLAEVFFKNLYNLKSVIPFYVQCLFGKYLLNPIDGRDKIRD